MSNTTTTTDPPPSPTGSMQAPAEPAAATSGITTDVQTGNCWEGFQNQHIYKDLVGEQVTVDAGITGLCDGPGNGAVVARGNYNAGIAPDYPDSCNAAAKPYWHEADTDFDGPNPRQIEMLNTFGGGYSIAVKCIQVGNNYASAAWENYSGLISPYNYIGLGWGQPGWGGNSPMLIQGPYTCCSTVTSN